MAADLNIVALIGSLRRESFNRAVFDAAVELSGNDVKITEHPIRDLPLYDGDLEDAGDPPTVVAIKNAVKEADGLILFSPEYNGAVPGGLKNAFDWLSRVMGNSALTDATVGVVTASPGGRAGQGVRDYFEAIGPFLIGDLFPNLLGIGGVNEKVTDGELADPDTRQELADWLEAFTAYIKG